MKICLPCPGLEHIQRGFESYTKELHSAISGATEAHLVKASGSRSPNQHVVRAVRRDSDLLSILPARLRTEYRRFQIECWTFAFAMIPLLMREKYDIIHFSEVPLGDALAWLRRRFGFGYRMLVSNGAPWPPNDCARFDWIHQVSPAHYQSCLDAGIPENRQFMVPYGFDHERLERANGSDQPDLRAKWNIPRDSFVVLSLAALNSSHKRIDWLIQEFSKISDKPDCFLLMAGNHERETQKLRELAEALLPAGRWQMIQVQPDDVAELLGTADVMVQASLDEGFGRTLVEAMLASTALLVHPHLTARYLVASEESFVDMTAQGALSDVLHKMAAGLRNSEDLVRRNRLRALDFSWDRLKEEYLKMYQAILPSS